VRRIPLSRRPHVTGFQPLATGTAAHESALERDFVTLTSFLDAGAAITSQPMTISFVGNGRSRRYTPDFRVAWSDGRLDLVEIKYRADLRANWLQLKPGFAAARCWIRERGGRFRIATERTIRGQTLENAKWLLPLRAAPLDVETAEMALAVVRTLPAPTFGSVVAALPLSRSISLGVLWRLMARGALRVDLTAPISFSTPVSLP
jgi:TnsA endonuclease N terminal